MGIDELDTRRREAEVASPGEIGRVAVEPPQRPERPAWQVERVSGPDAAKDGRTYTFRLTRADNEARLVRVSVFATRTPSAPCRSPTAARGPLRD